MDLQYLFKILWNRKWLIIIITVSAVVISYFLAGLLPPTYKSNAVLSTGITIEKSIQLSKEDVFVQKYEIESAFSNLMETMKSRTSIRILSYHLLLHDLLPDSTKQAPFRELDSDVDLDVSQKEINQLLNSLDDYKNNLWSTNLSQDDARVFNQLVKAYGYDYESLTEDLRINRIGETDYLNVEFESENPRLSEFVVNTFCKEFLRYNQLMVRKDENDAVQFYVDLARKKKARLDTLTNQLRNFRQSKNIINLESQSQAIVDQVKDLELTREEAKKDIAGHRKNIKMLNEYLTFYVKENVNKDDYVQDLNNRLTEVGQQIKETRLAQIDDGEIKFYEKGGLEKQKAVQEELITELAKQKNKTDEKESDILQDLLEKRVNEEIQLALKEEGVISINLELQRLTQNSQDLLLSESDIERFKSEKQVALEEYLQAVSKLNDARVVQQSALNPLQIFEHAQIPEDPEPSKRLLFAAFAGAGSASVAVFLIFFFTLFDNSLSTPYQFEKLTNVPLIGMLNHLRRRQLNLPELMSNSEKEKNEAAYNESLRKIRHRIEHSGAQTFLLTSTQEKVGKTTAALSLAYALSKRNKKVLLVDMNFKHNSLTQYANKEITYNPLYNGHANGHHVNGAEGNSKLFPEGVPRKGKIDVIGNYPSSDSPSEILAGKKFQDFLNKFKQEYDYIFMEGASLNEYSDTRELTDYADKVIAIFDAPSILTRADKESLEFLNGLEDKFMGGILNQVDLKNLN